MKVSRVRTLILPLMALSLSACRASRVKPLDQVHQVTVATIQSRAVTLTQPYVCRINSHHYIAVRAPVAGSLGAVPIRDGHEVKRDDLLFQVKPPTDRDKSESENVDEVVSIKAPFDGVVDRIPHQQGSLVRKGESLTTLFDNSVMWVYFDVPEARYFEYKSAGLDQHKDDLKVELVLSNGHKYGHPGKLGAIGAVFNNAGNVAFRADFPNPERLLRHGQTATVLLSRVQNDAIVVPQRAVFEVQGKRYVYVVDKDDVARQREVAIQNEWEDLFVVNKGVGVNDTIVTGGFRSVRDGDKVRYAGGQPKKVMAVLK